MRILLSLFVLAGLWLPAAAPQEVEGRWRGRKPPVSNVDVGDYKAVKTPDGKVRHFPRLGKHADLAKLAAGLPDECDWAKKAPNVLKRMYLNDRYGCCVISSRFHQYGFWTGADTGQGGEGTDQEVLAAYRGICGPGDNGCYMAAVNEHQQRHGLQIGGLIRKIRGAAAVDNTNKELVKGAIYYGGGLSVGFALPNDWFQSPDGSTWDVTNAPTVGGHEVQVYGYNKAGVLLSTWGGWRTMTWAAFTSRRWVDECYVALSADWYGQDGLAPNGIDTRGLEAAFAAISGGVVPPVPDPVPPAPVPPGPGPGPQPVPGGAYTGVITVTTTYKDGKVVGQPVTSVGGSAGGLAVEEELKAAGVSPALIAAVLKLLADVRARADKEVILADVMRIILTLGGLTNAGAAPPCCGAAEPAAIFWRREPIPAPRELAA